MGRDVIVVFVDRALAEGKGLELATGYAWRIGEGSVRGLKYAIPVTHVRNQDGSLRAEPLAVYEITGYYPAEDRFAFTLVPSDREVVVGLPQMFGPYVYRDSLEVFEGVASLPRRSVRRAGSARRQGGRRPQSTQAPQVCPEHWIALPASGLCDAC